MVRRHFAGAEWIRKFSSGDGGIRELFGRISGKRPPGRVFTEESKVRRPAALLPAWGLIRQPRSPKRLGHRVAADGSGIARARTRLAGSETFLRSRRGVASNELCTEPVGFARGGAVPDCDQFH